MNLIARVISMELGMKNTMLERYVEQLAYMIATQLTTRQASRFRFVPSARERVYHRARAKYLLTLPQAPQGSKQWFDYRRGTKGPDGILTGGRLTASDTGTILGMNEYACSEEIILKKAGIPTFNWSPACEHGKKYEHISVRVFERREGKCVREYGCLPDENNTITAASPDGITLDGEVLEIKNPYSRKVTGVPKPAYYAQIQQQLQVTDLELCHFVETVIREYPDAQSFREDHPENEPDAIWTDKGNEKGVLLEIMEEPAKDASPDDPPTYRYVYGDLDMRPSEVGRWINREMNKLGDLEQYRFVIVRYWYLATYCNTHVYRDRAWWTEKYPLLKQFWNRVEKARRDPATLERARVGYAAFMAVKNARFGRGPKTKKRRLALSIDVTPQNTPQHTPNVFGPEIEL